MPMWSKLAKSAARWGVSKKAAGGGLIGTGLGYVATRIATRSVPGALLVGGALAGKYFYDRHKARSETIPAEPTVDQDALATEEATARKAAGKSTLEKAPKSKRGLKAKEPTQVRAIGRVN